MGSAGVACEPHTPRAVRPFEPTVPNPAIADVCHIVAPFVEGRGGASRAALLWTAMNAWAGAGTISLLMRLPSNFYGTLAQVQQQLEGGQGRRAVAVAKRVRGPSPRSG